MSFNWSEYLALAQQLAGKAIISATQESRLRSAISRAYYAAFIQARNFLSEREGVVIPNQKTHQFVIAQFMNSPDAVSQRIGKDLQIIPYNRNLADYKNTFANLPDRTRRMLKLAAKVIADLQSL